MVVWAQGEVSAILLVEDGCEDGWRVEMRRAEPIDGAIDAYQRGGVQVSNKTVIFDTQIHSNFFDPPRVPNTLDANYRKVA